MPVAPAVIAALLLAALLHASWNALVKSDPDRLSSFGVLMATGGVVGLLALPFVEAPGPATWPYLAVSVAIHNLYYFLLLEAYRFGDLSHVYPIARGLGPLLVAALSALLVGEELGPAGLAGLLLVSGGILALGLPSRTSGAAPLAPTLYALATGCSIACYTVVDGLGARLADSTLGYVAWLAVLDAPWVLTVAAIRRGGRFWPHARSHAWRGAVGGVIAVVGYGIAVWALSLGAMAHVAALRETSVLFASAIGTLWLGESFGRRRAAAAACVAAGLVVMNLPRG